MTEHEMRVYIKEHPPEAPPVSFLSWFRKFRRGMLTGEGTTVPCGTCVECCKCLVFPAKEKGDDPSLYDLDEDGYIKQTPEGWCIYLKDGKCSVYDKRPFLCRVYDCRTMTATQTIVCDPTTKNVIETCEAAFRKFRVVCKTPEDKLAYMLVKTRLDNLALQYSDTDSAVLILAALMSLEI